MRTRTRFAALALAAMTVLGGFGLGRASADNTPTHPIGGPERARYVFHRGPDGAPTALRLRCWGWSERDLGKFKLVRYESERGLLIVLRCNPQ